MVERVMNGHDVGALSEYSSNPSVIGSGTALVIAFPDLEATVRWIERLPTGRSIALGDPDDLAPGQGRCRVRPPDEKALLSAGARNQPGDLSAQTAARPCYADRLSHLPGLTTGAG
jgi:hypothetical protein